MRRRYMYPIHMRPLLLVLIFTLLPLFSSCAFKQSKQQAADKPLFRDPVHDGAADPVIVWNAGLNKHVMYYTNRRADIVDEEGVRWVHGTRIGMAVSANGGASHLQDFFDPESVAVDNRPYFRPESTSDS